MVVILTIFVGGHFPAILWLVVADKVFDVGIVMPAKEFRGLFVVGTVPRVPPNTGFPTSTGM